MGMKIRTEILMVIIVCFLLLIPGCKKNNEAPYAARSEAGQTSAYTLIADDMKFEVKRTDAGNAEAPWAAGISATRYDSRLLKIKNGFDFDDDFIAAHGNNLKTYMSEYNVETAEAYSELGWQYFDKTGAREIVSVKFSEPLQWYKGASGKVQSSVAAKIMKSDATAIFSPRGKLASMPELEAGAEASLTGEAVEIETGKVRITYNLEIKGTEVVRSFNANGKEWIETDESKWPADIEQQCSVNIIRSGEKIIENSSGVWKLSQDEYTETWEAFDKKGSMIVSESSMSGPAGSYSLAPSDEKQHGVPAGGTVFDVTVYGAKGDGVTLDTASIQAAVDACADAGGGEVVFPAGTYMCASVHLESGVTIHLLKGATVKGTREMDKYDPREPNPWDAYQDISQSHVRHSIFHGENIENVAIVGPGMIDGNDAFENLPVLGTTPPPPWCWIISTIAYQFTEKILQRGAKPVGFKECRNVFIKDITIAHAADEAIWFAGCENVLIEGYKAREVRVDGVDPVCSKNVTIDGCEIKSIDDSVAVKSSYTLGRKENVENLTVKNSLVSSFVNALKIGTESVGTFRNVAFRNCWVKDLKGFPSFGGISMISVDGGTLDGITAENIKIENANYPIFIRVGDRLRTPEAASVGSAGNITIRNVTATGGMGFGASIIAAVEGGVIGPDIVLEDIDITCLGGGAKWQSYRDIPDVHESDGVYPDPVFIVPGLQPAYAFFVRRAKGLELRNINVRYVLPDLRAAFILEETDAVMQNVLAERCALGAPSVIQK
jgi:polygalacturonase